MSTDEFHKVGFEKDPSAPDLGTWQTPCLRAFADFLLVHAEEVGSLDEVQSRFGHAHEAMMSAPGAYMLMRRIRLIYRGYAPLKQPSPRD